MFVLGDLGSGETDALAILPSQRPAESFEESSDWAEALAALTKARRFRTQLEVYPEYEMQMRKWLPIMDSKIAEISIKAR